MEDLHATVANMRRIGTDDGWQYTNEGQHIMPNCCSQMPETRPERLYNDAERFPNIATDD